MSSGYSANQYDGAFRADRMQNWCLAKSNSQRPAAHRGHTTIISDDRGHLLPGVVKRGNMWPDFKGTWDLPARIPAHHINPTARSQDGLSRLRAWGIDPQAGGKSSERDAAEQSGRRSASHSGGETGNERVPSGLQASPVPGGSPQSAGPDAEGAPSCRPDSTATAALSSTRGEQQMSREEQ